MPQLTGQNRQDGQLKQFDNRPPKHPFPQKRPFDDTVKRLSSFDTNTYIANMSVRFCPISRWRHRKGQRIGL